MDDLLRRADAAICDSRAIRSEVRHSVADARITVAHVQRIVQWARAENERANVARSGKRVQQNSKLGRLRIGNRHKPVVKLVKRQNPDYRAKIPTMVNYRNLVRICEQQVAL